MTTRFKPLEELLDELPLPQFHQVENHPNTARAREAERQALQAQIDCWLSEGNSIEKLPADSRGFRGGQMNLVMLGKQDRRISRRKTRDDDGEVGK